MTTLKSAIVSYCQKSELSVSRSIVNANHPAWNGLIDVSQNDNAIWERHGAVVCRRNHVDIFCRLSTMHERDSQTDRSRNGNIDCNWRYRFQRCRLIMRQFIEEEEEDIYLNAVARRKSLQRRLITLDASTAAIDRSSKPEPQKDNKKTKTRHVGRGLNRRRKSE